MSLAVGFHAIQRQQAEVRDGTEENPQADQQHSRKAGIQVRQVRSSTGMGNRSNMQSKDRQQREPSQPAAPVPRFFRVSDHSEKKRKDTDPCPSGAA